MNDRFFNLSEEKQNRIINAAYKVFGQNEYRKAPMSEIAEAGDISKSLLFHYFGNKLGLYMFLWERAYNLSREAMKKNHVYDTDDFFEMLERSLFTKCDLIRQYPYLSLFILKAYYEEDPEVCAEISKRFEGAKENTFSIVTTHLNSKGVREDFTLEEVYKEILYASDGYLQQQYRGSTPDPDKLKQEYSEMIKFWRRAFGVKEVLNND